MAHANLSEAEFFRAARSFLRDTLGVDYTDLDPDLSLIGSGALDSLRLLMFLDFLEETRGGGVFEVTELNLSQGISLRSSYRLVCR